MLLMINLSTNIEVAAYAAELLRIKSLKPVSIYDFKKCYDKSSYKDSKKLATKK